MNSVTPAVVACARGAPGEVSVRFLFESSGAVTSVTINPTYSWFAGESGPDCESTPDDSGYYSCQRIRPPNPGIDECVVRAARPARVPPFEQSAFSVNYPFRF